LSTLSRSYDDHHIVKVTVWLPKYLADWLDEFSREIAMEPGQLLTHILHYYYEAYKKGLSKAESKMQPNIEIIVGKEQKDEEVQKAGGAPDLMKIAYRFIEAVKYAAKYKYIVIGFAKWLESKGITEPSFVHVEEFLNEYVKDHSPAHRTLEQYKYLLKSFLKYIREERATV